MKKNIKILEPKVQVKGFTKGKYFYKVNNFKGLYTLSSYNKKTGQFIFKKFNKK